MTTKSNALLQDSGMERAILAGITTYGSDCFFSVEDILKVTDFYWPINQKLFAIFTYLVHKEDTKVFDAPGIHAAAKILGYDELTDGGKNAEYVDDIIAEIGSSEENIRSLVVAVYKLSLARRGYLAAAAVQQNLKQITGAEDIDTIISQIEEPIFEFTGQVMDQGGVVVTLGKRFADVMTTLEESPQDIVGLPTGFPAWDAAIGGGLRPATVNIVGARPKQGKCHGSFDTIVLTNDGALMPYEIFDAKNSIGKINCSELQILNESGEQKTPEYWWNNGFVDVIKISTKYGNTLSATPNHPIQILDIDGKIKWRNMEDLELGDYLVCRRGDRFWGNADMSHDDAYVLGLLVGDGCINDKIVDLASIDTTCRKQFKSFIDRKGGDIGTEDYFHVRCNRTKVAKQISQLGFYDKDKKKIFPVSIRKGKEKIVCQALCGYFDADGCVEHIGVTATTNSPKLAIQLKTMLLNLGILSKTRVKSIVPPGHVESRNYFEIAIQNTESIKIFKELIGFRIAKKQRKLEILCRKKESTKNDTVPNLKLPLLGLKKFVTEHRGYFIKGCDSGVGDNVNRWIRGSRAARRDAVEELLSILSEYNHLPEYITIQNLIDKHLLFDPIKNLSKGNEWTSDFYVPDGHSFVTNGMISHNSFFCINVAKNMAENKIPVLYLDTELTSEVQLHRLSALVSGVDLERIESGKFKHNANESEALWSCKEQMENLQIDHFSVAGLSPQAIMSIARRWLSKTVGFTDTGNAKPCLIIYDYLKLMDDGGFKHNLQEYQLLGFLITALHNFAVKFKLPILATVQLNRDGVEKEGAEVVSGSDRIVWLCSNFSILKKKIQTELNEDPPSNGTKKLVVTDTRYGGGMESGDYINIIDKLQCGRLIEGKAFSVVTQEASENLTNETI